jgi:hypothetical protein
VDVHAADQEPTCRPLHRLDQPAIAGIGADELVAREPERVRAGAHQREVAPFGRCAQLGERDPQVVAGLGRRLADAGDDLDGALEQFVFRLRVLAAGVDGAEFGQELGGRRDEVTGHAVDDVQLHLDADRRSWIVGELDSHGASPSAVRPVSDGWR